MDELTNNSLYEVRGTVKGVVQQSWNGLLH